MPGSFRIPPGMRIPDFPSTEGGESPTHRSPDRPIPDNPPRRVDPVRPSSHDPNHPGRPQGGGGSQSSGGGENRPGGRGNSDNTFEQHPGNWMDRIGSRQHKRVEAPIPILPFAVLTAVVHGYATYYGIINNIVAMIGRSVWTTAIAAAARLGTFVGTRAVASAWLGPWGVTAVTVASIVVFFAMSESANAAQQSPLEKYRREVSRLWQVYNTSSDPSVQLETLRKLFLVVYGMQLCLDAAIREQIYLGGQIYSNAPQKKQAILSQYVSAVVQYKETACLSGAAMQQILSAADSLLMAIQRHYGWNQAMMVSRHDLYRHYFNNFRQNKLQWDAQLSKIKTDEQSVENALFHSKFT